MEAVVRTAETSMPGGTSKLSPTFMSPKGYLEWEQVHLAAREFYAG